MDLFEISNCAERLAAAGDHVGAEELLSRATVLVTRETDKAALFRFAWASHNWGPPEAEEAALRQILRQGDHLEAIVSLLDLLQQRLNIIIGEERTHIVEECIELGTEAIRLCGNASGPAWANLIHARGVRHLDLARAGAIEHAPDALIDLQAYHTWLQHGEDVPENWNRATMIAMTEVDMGEGFLLQERQQDAVSMLKRAARTLEEAKAPDWMTTRLHALLELASQ